MDDMILHVPGVFFRNAISPGCREDDFSLYLPVVFKESQMENLTNAKIKMIRSLKDKKFRDGYGLFVVEGEKLVAEALRSSFEVEAVYRMEEIGADAMAKISHCSSPSPVLAVLRIPGGDAGTVRKVSRATGRKAVDANADGPAGERRAKCGGAGQNAEKAGTDAPCEGLCLALDAVRDPGNMGTILRIADWFGVDRVYLSRDCADIYNPKVVQASMGSIFRVNAAVADLPEISRQFKASGCPVYGMVLGGENIYGHVLEDNALVIMGNESNGISAELRREMSCGLCIPSFGKSGAESLNVAVATAVALSEIRRR